MGIIRRQSILNLLSSYFGVALGYVNKILLFTVFLTKEEFGLIEVLLAVGVICMSFAQLGIVQITIRFYPYFSSTLQRLRSFNFLLLVYPILGSLLISMILWIFKPEISALYEERSPLFVVHYFYVFPLFIGLTFIAVFNGFCRANLKSVVPTFLNEVFLRLWQMISVVLYHWEWFDFEGFLLFFVAGYFVDILLLLAYLISLGNFQIKLDLKILKGRVMRIAANFGIFSFLFRITDSLVTRLDVAMLGMLAGLEASAVYVFGLYIAIVIFVPTRAIYGIALPIVSKGFKDRDMDAVLNLYRQTSLHSLMGGLLIFIGIWINLDIVFDLRPGFEGARFVVLWIGLAKLFDMASGINGGIIMNSKHYRFNLYANVCLLVFVGVSNYLLIPIYQEIGAAIATALSIFFFNFAKGVFVYLKFRMQPFTLKTLQLLGIAGISLAAGMLLPKLEPWWLDFFLRSALVTALYGLPVYFLKISPQANQFVHMTLKRIGVMK